MKIHTSLRHLVVEKTGYLSVDKQGAGPPVQVISNQYERSSIVVTTYRTFRDWGAILNNDNILFIMGCWCKSKEKIIA